MQYHWEDKGNLGPVYNYNLAYLAFQDAKSVEHARISLFDASQFADALAASGENGEPLLRAIRQFLPQFETFHCVDAIAERFRQSGLLIGSFLPIAAAGPEGAVDPEELIREFLDGGCSRPPGGCDIGIVDVGIAFANAAFRYRTSPDPCVADRTRFDMLWLQDKVVADPARLPKLPPSTWGGTFLFRPQIQALIDEFWDRQRGALDEESIYRLFRPVTSQEREALRLRRPHGTQVLDLICGTKGVGGQDDGNRRIYAVDLPSRIIAETSGAFTGPFMLVGILAIAGFSAKIGIPGGLRPLVINASLAFSQGPNDGSHPYVTLLDLILEMATEGGKRVVTCTLPTGNHLQDRLHAQLDQWPGGAAELTWQIQPDDRSASFLELWPKVSGSGYTKPPERIGLTPPDADSPIQPVPFEFNRLYSLVNEANVDVARAYCLRYQSRPRTVVAVRPTMALRPETDLAPAGRWRLRVEKQVRGDTQPAELWISRDDTIERFRPYGRQSYLVDSEYRRFLDSGDLSQADQQKAMVKRVGTRSVLASGSKPGCENGYEITRCADPAALRPYRFGGCPREPTELRAVCDEGRATGGVLAAGRVGRTVLHFGGTSAAAAIRARAEVAAADQNTAQPVPGITRTHRDRGNQY